MRNQYSRGFSMVEVIVASVIFAASAVGIMATIGFSSSPSVTNDARTKAARLGKKILDGLNKEVKSDINSGLLAAGNHSVAADPDFPGYTANYTVTLVNPGTPTVQHKVDLLVTW